MSSYSYSIPATSQNSLSVLTLPDCIFLEENCKCGVLNIRQCKGSCCTFLLTKSGLTRSEAKWKERLNCISEEKQQQIAKCYYGGKRIWQAK